MQNAELMFDYRAVQLLDDRVVKTQNPSAAAIEHTKTNAAYNVSLIDHSFIVPRILSYDQSLGVISFEKIPRIQSLRALIQQGRMTTAIAEQVGRSLAILHSHIELPDEYITPLSEIWSHAQGRDVFLHGDFSCRNVFYDLDRNKPVLLDWAFSDRWESKATYGTYYYDLANMLDSIFMAARFGLFPIRGLGELCDAIVDSYHNAVGLEVPPQLWQYSLAWSRNSSLYYWNMLGMRGRAIHKIKRARHNWYIKSRR